MNEKPHSFNGMKGVVGLRRWIEKVEQVFEIFKCAEEDKVMFTASTFEGRALTWWNGNVHTLGLVNANRDDIEAYSNRFHELVLMCPELVSTKKKKIEKYIRGFPERIKGNITSSKPTTLHDAINMARTGRAAFQGRAARIGKSNRKEMGKPPKIQTQHTITPTNNNNRNRNNNHHQQQNRRQETARAYAVAPAESRGYTGNLPRCNRYNSHYNGQFPQKCWKFQRTSHQEKDCRARVLGAGVTPFRMRLVMDAVKKDITRISVQKEGTSGMRELVGELTWWLKIRSRIRIEKGLVAKSFDWDEESISSEDERVTKVKAFMAIIEDEPSVGKADARSGQ
ncbi:hypothetical protein Tco_1242662 [Tanacetum coccineum]